LPATNSDGAAEIPPASFWRAMDRTSTPPPASPEVVPIRAAIWLRHLVTFMAVWLGASALGLLFFPGEMLSAIGLQSNDESDFLARCLGVAFASLVPTAWASRGSMSNRVARGVIQGLVRFLFLGAAVEIHAVVREVLPEASIVSVLACVVLGTTMLGLMLKLRRFRGDLP
jgi:hypothetical protein